LRKHIVRLVILGLAVGAVAAPASARKAPQKVSLYLHGSQPAGEAELPQTWANSHWLQMDKKKPAGAAPKSMNVTNYVGGPNTKCSGNGLLPTWTGRLTGTVKGTVKVTLHTVATPAAALKVELFPDGNGGCNSTVGSTGYAPPAAAKVVTVAPGPATTVVTFKKVNFRVVGSLVMQLSIANAPNPAQVRVLYDGAGYESGVQLSVAR
jgi:hypothetical protein